MYTDLKIFALNSSKEFGKKIANKLECDLSVHEEKYFQDGEVYCASSENVRGKDIFFVHSLYSDNAESINDKFLKTLIMAGSLKDASANRITCVLPTICYSRQDRKTASRAPITTKYIAQMLEAVGVNRVLTIDAHNPTALQNAFKINVDLLEANELFARYIASEIKDGKFAIKKNQLVVMSDVGGMTRVKRFCKTLGKYIGESVDIACIDKLHTNAGEITAERIVGNVKDKFIIVLDDIIASGKTIYECAEASRKAGANGILAVCATHGLFVGNANEYLDHGFVQRYVITDTITPFRLTNNRIKSKLKVLSTTDLFAEAISRIHRSESITDLIENGMK